MQFFKLSIISCAVIFLLNACHKETESNVTAPGTAETTKTKVLETGADILQRKPPIAAINAYLDGFHFYNGKQHVQMEAHHYCAILNEDVIQCVIYDGNVKDAKLMGVEYILSAKLFKTLPDSEKALWHSHVQEVKSGQLIAPGIPDVAEKELMKKLVGTYGKTWHTWHTDVDKVLPLGVPQLMMGFTADGQSDPAMIAERDKRFGIYSAKKRKDREDIPSPPIDPAVNAWEHGKTYQIADPTDSQHSHEAAPAKKSDSRETNARSNKE
ncbi:OBAP family protein [Glaciimonas immobilis]|uniref:DUF1264 domain-containing protein n=1 Tax=Glaciimonas immobilis TaxID=728004 RepID=A0A840RMF0_9BURK|nr:OBAP family protein [Glaciimonas immobilis]KAF3999429.1 OBAP family protein [Glaciimonas immobilis]MBB5198933.1 hypothetical protein [Glaciimonas immobilis]